MPSTIVIPTTTIPAGTRAFGPNTIQPSITSLILELDRTAWVDPALRITVSLDLSLDSGATWSSTSPGPATNPFPMSIEAVGGIILDHQGNPLTKTTFGTGNIPNSGQSGRRLRGTFTNNLDVVTSGTLVTQ
jgi:hypothetical protein